MPAPPHNSGPRPATQRLRGGPRPMSCWDTMGKVFGNKTLRRNSFYLLLLFLALLTCVDFVKLIHQYMTDNVDSDIYIQFNDTMTMPNVTFCIDKQHAWSHFSMAGLNSSVINKAVEDSLANMTDRKSFLGQQWDYRMIIDAYLVIQMLNSMERETSWEGVLHTIEKLTKEPRLVEMRQSIKKWLAEITKRGVSFEEFQQKVGQETLKKSLQRFQRLSANKEGRQIRNGVKITWLSQWQLCFQPYFDEANFQPIADQDQFFTLSLAHNTENVKDIGCMSVDLHGRPSSSTRFMEGKGRTKDGFTEELCIGDMHEVEIEVRNMYTSLPGAEEVEKRCLVYEDGNSEFGCRSRCRMELIRKACACTPLTLSYLATDPDELDKFPLCDYQNCAFNNATNFTDWDDKCGAECYPDCTQIRYILQHTMKTSPRKEVLQVTLFWGSFEYLRLIQKEKWSFSQFFSNLGGSLGVWLGLSVLSVIQFITFLLTRAHKRVKRKLSTVSDGRGQSRASSNPSGGSEHQDSTRSSSNNPLGRGISMNPFGGGGKKEKV